MYDIFGNLFVKGKGYESFIKKLGYTNARIKVEKKA